MIARYARPQMASIWEPETKFRIWFEIEAHALDKMAELGIVPIEAAKAVWERGAFEVDQPVGAHSELAPDADRGLGNPFDMGERAGILGVQPVKKWADIGGWSDNPSQDGHQPRLSFDLRVELFCPPTAPKCLTWHTRHAHSVSRKSASLLIP